MFRERIEGRVGGGEHFYVETLVERARQKFRCLQLGCDRIVVKVGGFFRELLIEAEEFLKLVVEPDTRGRAAKEIVVAGEDAPHFARVFDLGLADLQIVQRNALAVEHAVDVMVGLHEQLCRIGKGLVVREPTGLRVPVRTDDGQGANLCVESACDGSSGRIGGKKSVFVEQHDRVVPWPERLRSQLRRSDHDKYTHGKGRGRSIFVYRIIGGGMLIVVATLNFSAEAHAYFRASERR